MRLEDWPEKLTEYLSLDHKFDWIKNNCALFASGGCVAITGKDCAKSYRKIKTKAGMIRKLKKEGGLKGAWTNYFGEPIPVLMAQRGDAVLTKVFIEPTVETEAIGICIGSEIAVLTEIGITKYPLNKGLCAWRVI